MTAGQNSHWYVIRYAHAENETSEITLHSTTSLWGFYSISAFRIPFVLVGLKLWLSCDVLPKTHSISAFKSYWNHTVATENDKQKTNRCFSVWNTRWTWHYVKHGFGEIVNIPRAYFDRLQIFIFLYEHLFRLLPHVENKPSVIILHWTLFGPFLSMLFQAFQYLNGLTR